MRFWTTAACAAAVANVQKDATLTSGIDVMPKVRVAALCHPAVDREELAIDARGLAALLAVHRGLHVLENGGVGGIRGTARGDGAFVEGSE